MGAVCSRAFRCDHHGVLLSSDSTKSRISRFTFTGSRDVRAVPRALERDHREPVDLGERRASGERVERVLGPVDHERGTANPAADIAAFGAAELCPPWLSIIVSGAVSSPQPTQSSICSSNGAR